MKSSYCLIIGQFWRIKPQAPVPKPRLAAFTLVEMAVVLVIIGLVMLTVFPALNAVRSANQRMVTQTNLRALLLATASYVQASGCVPCPAVAAIGASFGGTGNGVACATTSAGKTSNACAAAEGIPPFAALGVPASTAHDGWGHWITMRVDPALTVLPSSASTVFVPPAAICSQADATAGYCTTAQVGTAAKGLCSSTLSKTSRISVTIPAAGSQQAAVIFVSHGKDGYGSLIASPLTPATNGYRLPFTANYAACAAGGYAQCNANNTAQFYDAPLTGGDVNPYDDMLAFADRNSLISMLGNNGCATVW